MSPTMPASTADDVGGLQFPTGLGPFPYLGVAQPAGWYLVKPGQGFEIEAIADFPALAQLVGVRWGGDGVTTFAMPQAGLFTRGPDGVHALWSLMGEDTHVLTAAELAPHAHAVNDPGHGHGVNDPGHEHRGYNPNPDSAAGADTHSVITPGGNAFTHDATGISIQGAATGVTVAASGGGGAHNTIPRSIVTNLIVKA